VTGTDTAEQPEWSASYPTRDEAIAAALDMAGPDEDVWVHDASCAMKLDLDCDCGALPIPRPSVVQ
jgi:hypothetical protein